MCMDTHSHPQQSVELFIHFGLVLSATFHLMLGCSRRPSELLTCSLFFFSFAKCFPEISKCKLQNVVSIWSTFLHLNSKNPSFICGLQLLGMLFTRQRGCTNSAAQIAPPEGKIWTETIIATLSSCAYTHRDTHIHAYKPYYVSIYILLFILHILLSI